MKAPFFEDLYEAIVESTLDGILVVDADGRIVFANARAEDLFGYSRDDLHGQTLGLIIPERFREQHAEHVRSYLTLPRVRPMGPGIELWARHHDGREFPIEVSLRPLPVHGYVLSAVRDVTEVRRLEAQLRASQRMEAVGRLASGIAHDFNNLLMVIKTFGGFVHEALTGHDEGREDAQMILDAANRAADLTRQLLAFSRRQIQQLELLDLGEVVAALEKMLRRVIGEDLDLQIHLTDGLWPVHADRSQLEQVIMNLAVNARDAMPEGGRLTIETANVELDEGYGRTKPAQVVPGSYVMLAVSDSGVGMDAALQRRIFEPFFTTKSKDRGTGLGLSTVYGIVKQSGGYIWTYSEPSRGTTFKVYLPRVEAERDEAALVEGDGPTLHGSETILLAEDEASVRKATRRILERRGYTVIEAANGVEAVRVAAEHSGSLHLLLTDMVMPHLGGRALAERLAARRPELRVLFMSGYSDSSIDQQGVLDGVVHFIQKPFTAKALLSRIREILEA